MAPIIRVSLSPLDNGYWVCETIWLEERHERDVQGEVSTHKVDIQQNQKVKSFLYQVYG